MTMPGSGNLPPRVVAEMIREAKERGKCAQVSTLGFVCTNPADHGQSPHVATDAHGNVKDVWMTAPGAWDAEQMISLRVNALRDKAARGDELAASFMVSVGGLEASDHDFVKAWERVLGLIEAMPRLTAQDGMELLSYFITRCCWSDPDTIPRSS
jgi:hypothetical protein